MRLLIIFLLSFIPISGIASDKLIPVGDYEAVRGTGSGHCYGWSLSLWEKDGMLMGLLDWHAGLCGDPPCSTINVESYNKKTGELKFTTNEKLGFNKQTFIGRLTKSAVVGKLGDEEVEMKGGLSSRTYALPKRDTSMIAWCKSWSRIGRCKGTDRYCELKSEPYVHASILNVRRRPSKRAAIVGKLRIGTRVTVRSSKSGWLQISTEDPKSVNGWVLADFLNINSPTVVGLLKKYNETPEGDLKNRKKWAERAVALQPDNVAALLKLKEIAILTGDSKSLAAVNGKLLAGLGDQLTIADAEKLYQSRAYSDAFRAYLLLAESGNAEAQLRLSELWRQGRGAARNHQQSLLWLKKAAEKGNAEAQFRFAEIRFKGHQQYNVENNQENALPWFQKADAQGHPDAAYYLARYHEEGLAGYPENPIQALKYLEKASARGSKRACKDLGDLYANGGRVKRDTRKAIKYLGCSVQQKYPNMYSLFSLSDLYQELPESPNNNIQAYKWFILGRMNYPDDSGPEDYKELDKKQGVLRGKLSKEQVKQAIDSAVLWAKEHSETVYKWMTGGHRKEWLYRFYGK